MELKHYITVKDGKAVFEDRSRFDSELKQHEGKRCYITVKRHRKQKSNQQQRYYWGVVIAILAEAFGYTPDECHAAIGHQFLRYRKGNGPIYVRSTKLTEWTTDEWEEYMEKIRQWASIEHSVNIPLPNEIDY